MTRALVLQHIRCEPPGLFSSMLNERGVAIETIELDEGGELPDWREVDLVLAMGGPMSVHDEAEHPWLAGEKRWIAAAVRAGVPYLGVCLGGLGDEFPALQWHGDTFAIPAGAVHLAGSEAYPQQAFRFGETAYAIQFHVEVTGEMLAEWRLVPAYQRSAEAALGSAGFEILAAGFAAARASMARSASLMFTGWLDQARRAAARRGGDGRAVTAG